MFKQTHQAKKIELNQNIENVLRSHCLFRQPYLVSVSEAKINTPGIYVK